MKLLRKLRNIIIGNINNLFGLNKEISNSRMRILKAKTTVENEHCKLNKW